jgi:hypothetical protein
VNQDADDRTILDPDPLWRRIHPDQFVSDGQSGWRVSSAAFDNSRDGSGMSVSLGREAQAAGVDPSLALQRFPGFGMASVTAGECRKLEQWIERDPTRADPYHALVNGCKPKRVQRELAKAAKLLIRPREPNQTET